MFASFSFFIFLSFLVIDLFVDKDRRLTETPYALFLNNC
ncbi:hypothetical protein BACOVA_03174 [Bacteroides ovatus ATCC 8483]|uniref:Uncharacterized protein n=1 Tax=Bacteroides ovatus (strain ATCC 8483 / DSM 1896 / JCM 5824 / BCRC 10623 / CCUG 4943 / NCTC 11153) TaxID=411476 RepID=A0AAN3D7M2_BACO1|nr:hypothetical protein BACOVA_03174 [Bacteroides ovatus ATCC 8483]